MTNKVMKEPKVHPKTADWKMNREKPQFASLTMPVFGTIQGRSEQKVSELFHYANRSVQNWRVCSGKCKTIT